MFVSSFIIIKQGLLLLYGKYNTLAAMSGEKDRYMETRIIQATAGNFNEVQMLFLEYMHWANSLLDQTYGVKFDVDSMVAEDMQKISKFMPPKGRLLLCYADQTLAGIACLHDSGMGFGEIKRMYVRPEFRKQGLGRALLNQIIDEAGLIGYDCLRLDSARFMTDAHRLYHSLGFQEIDAYEGSEIPKEYQSMWIFMEKTLG